MQYNHNSYLTPFARRLRKEMTKEERHLWYDFLRDYPVKFYRQRVIGQYIADFYCAKARLIVELDGSQHYEPEEQMLDKKRTEYLETCGLAVLRVPNNEVSGNFRGVCEYIHIVVCDRTKK